MTEHQSRDVRREQILDAASKLFSSKGFENSSVDDIAASAHLSKGAIYWHFASKLDILLELTDRFVRENQREIVKLADDDEYGPEALYKSHRIYWQRMRDYPANDELFGQLVGLAGQHPEIRERLFKYQREWDDTVTVLLDRAVDAGHFRPFNTHHVAQAINALYHGVMVHCKLDPDLSPVDVIETTTKLLYEALVVQLPVTTEGAAQ